MKYLFSVFSFFFIFSSCTDETAYNSCKNTLVTASHEILQAKTQLDVGYIDKQINDTLYKYSHSRMSREMIEKIKSLKSAYEKNKTERMKFLKENDTVPARRIVEMPGIGLVEIKTPPEV